MGAVVFDNEIFDSWLTKKSEEILSKVDRDRITTEEMLTLILKAQTNHFHHMDVEFREEFKRIDQRFESIESKIIGGDKDLESKMTGLENRLEAKIISLETKLESKMISLETRLESKIDRLDQKFEDRFDKIWNFQKWQAGLLVGLFAGIYLKLFLG